MQQLRRYFSRAVSFVLPAIVVVLTLGIVERAWTATTVANATTFGTNVNAGTSGTVFTPPANLPVMVIACQTNTGNVGSSEMTVVNSAGFDNELVWSGLESNAGGVTAGFSPTAGTHIIFIDFAHQVDLQVNNGTSFKIHNGSSVTQRVVVTMIW